MPREREENSVTSSQIYKHIYMTNVCVWSSDLSTESPDSSRVLGDSSTGRPFFSQLIWGAGLPAAWHSSVTALSWVTCSSLGTDVSPEMDGGTERRGDGAETHQSDTLGQSSLASSLSLCLHSTYLIIYQTLILQITIICVLLRTNVLYKISLLDNLAVGLLFTILKFYDSIYHLLNLGIWHSAQVINCTTMNYKILSTHLKTPLTLSRLNSYIVTIKGQKCPLKIVYAFFFFFA